MIEPDKAERCTCIEGVIGLCGACYEHLSGDGPKPLPPFRDTARDARSQP